MKYLPRYPIYIPSKGRFDVCYTAKVLEEDNVPYHLVVEPQEYDRYAENYAKDHLLVLPFSDQGSVIPARNWIKDHATKAGHERHWQLDDNIRKFRRTCLGKRIPVAAGLALRICEDFTDRYENVAISGLNYSMFVFKQRVPPFYVNVHVYSCTLVLNSVPYRWRGGLQRGHGYLPSGARWRLVYDTPERVHLRQAPVDEDQGREHEGTLSR